MLKQLETEFQNEFEKIKKYREGKCITDMYQCVFFHKFLLKVWFCFFFLFRNCKEKAIALKSILWLKHSMLWQISNSAIALLRSQSPVKQHTHIVPSHNVYSPAVLFIFHSSSKKSLINSQRIWSAGACFFKYFSM